MNNEHDVAYKCFGNDKSVERLYKAVLSCLNDNCYGTTLHDIAEKLGFHTSCVCEVTGVNFEDGYLIIHYTTDCCEQSEFRKALESKLPGMRIMFSEVGYEDNVFRTNDSGFRHFYRYALFDDDITFMKGFGFLFEVVYYLDTEYRDPDVGNTIIEMVYDILFNADNIDNSKDCFNILAEAIYNNDNRLHLVEMEVVD